MTERPILFTGEMVRAILAGHKTETRRVMKQAAEGDPVILRQCPYGVPGDRLYVKEALIGVVDTTLAPGETMPVAAYEADGAHIWTKDKYREPWGWKKTRLPSMFMPKRFARIWLEITGVGVRRVQEMDNNDALAEGTPDIRTTENNFDMRDCFHVLWDSLYAKRGCGWDVNPMVTVRQFRRIMK